MSEVLGTQLERGMLVVVQMPYRARGHDGGWAYMGVTAYVWNVYKKNVRVKLIHSRYGHYFHKVSVERVTQILDRGSEIVRIRKCENFRT